jgi:hypothetical protein
MLNVTQTRRSIDSSHEVLPADPRDVRSLTRPRALLLGIQRGLVALDEFGYLGMPSIAHPSGWGNLWLFIAAHDRRRGQLSTCSGNSSRRRWRARVARWLPREPLRESRPNSTDALTKAGEALARGSWTEARELFETSIAQEPREEDLDMKRIIGSSENNGMWFLEEEEHSCKGRWSWASRRTRPR